MEQNITLEEVREKLKANGYSGLYYPGECGCGIDDLAPCGECQEGGEYVNDCKPGYKHLDPRPDHAKFGDYVVTADKNPPEGDDFDSMYN